MVRRPLLPAVLASCLLPSALLFCPSTLALSPSLGYGKAKWSRYHLSRTCVAAGAMQLLGRFWAISSAISTMRSAKRRLSSLRAPGGRKQDWGPGTNALTAPQGAARWGHAAIHAPVTPLALL